jgi:hypothetical protein
MPAPGQPPVLPPGQPLVAPAAPKPPGKHTTAIVAGVVALVIGAGAGFGGGWLARSGGVKSADEAAAAAAGDLEEAQAKLESAREELTEAETKAMDLEGQLQDANDEIADLEYYATMGGDLAAWEEDLVAKEQELTEWEAELDQRDQQTPTGGASPTDGATFTDEAFGDGTYLVGTDIEPGIYLSEGGDSCYWERLSGDTDSFEDIIDNDYGPLGQAVVGIAATDYAFTSERCADWHRIY